MNDYPSLLDFRVDRGQVGHVGTGLARPECVLVDGAGCLWIADARGGVTAIAPDGAQRYVQQRGMSEPPGTVSRPNGLAFDADGSLLVANFGRRRLERMSQGGHTRVLLDELAGRPLGQVNFVLADRPGRIWLTISTQATPFFQAFRPDVADGQIIVIDEHGARVAADGLHFPNEVRIHPGGRWLYVAETTGRRIRRFRISPGNALSHPELVGPDNLGPGFPDGIAFDRAGNLWVAMVAADRVLAITPAGDVACVLDDGHAPVRAEIDAKFAAGALTGADLALGAGTLAPLMTSIAFGGAGMRTVYIGSLMGKRLAHFQTPIPGLRPADKQE